MYTRAMPNLRLTKKKKLAAFRKMAIGTRQNAYDPQVYGSMNLRMEEALRYLEAFRTSTGKKLTLNHMMAKATAVVLDKMPDANAILRWNRIYLRRDIGVFFQVAMSDPKTGEIDLSGATIFDAQKKTLVDIVDEFAAKVAKVRAGVDRKEGSRNLFRRVPFFMLNRLLKTISFFSYTLNLDLRWAGIPRDPFGSAMITNIGSLGLDEAYVPLVPYSRALVVPAMWGGGDETVVQ